MDAGSRVVAVSGLPEISSSQGSTVVRMECLPNTDEPSLESRGVVNVTAVV